MKYLIISFRKFINKFYLLILLPLTFVFFGLNKYPHLISLTAAVDAFFYSFFSILIFFLLPRIRYDRTRSILIASWVGGFFLFYRNVIETTTNIPLLVIFEKAPFNIGLFCLVSIPLLIKILQFSEGYIKSIHKYLKLFLTFCFVSLFLFWAYKLVGTRASLIKIDEILFENVEKDKQPDVYCILLDEYCGFASMKYYHKNDNNKFANKLKELNFFIANNPSSNYNRTWLSCPSLLGMNYINNLDVNDLNNNNIYLKSDKAVYENNVFSFFQSQGYNTFNNSFFNIKADHYNKDIIINIKRNVLIKNTLFEYAKTSFLNHIPIDFVQYLLNTKMAAYYKYNMSALEYFKSTIIKNDALPKFNYTHLLMPHPPLLFGSKGQKRFRDAYITSDKDESTQFVEYVNYVNDTLLDLITLILKKNKNSIIILTSDHGHRLRDKDELDFNTFFAIYKPDQNYNGFTDSISSVNIFRTLLNNEFRQKLPMLNPEKHNVLKSF